MATTGGEWQFTPWQEARAMYASHWSLRESPFGSVLDTRWYCDTPGHEEALARLLYVIEQRRRCGVLAGQTGAGKSLLLKVLAAEARRLPAEVALVDLLGRGTRELLWDTLAALGLGPSLDATVRMLWHAIENHLLSGAPAAISTVLALDHVERAETDALVAIERLHHLAASGEAALTLIVAVRSDRVLRLAPVLNEISDLRVELSPLDRLQTQRYIESLLARGGASRTIFDPLALDRLYEETRGIPRELNRLCDLSLLAGMADGAEQITDEIVAAAADELHRVRLAAGPLVRPRRRFAAEEV